MRQPGRRARGLPAERGRGKIDALLAKTADERVAAECLLAALGRTPPEEVVAHARMVTGAVLLARGLVELRNIRKLLTAPE